MKYLVGLGNPGRRYAKSRHNFGWLVLDRIVESKNVVQQDQKWDALCARTDALTLVKPQTFMNRSGKAVRQMVEEVGAEAKDILVIMDDLDLDFGTVRLRASGSSGGHRGLQSIIDALGSKDIPRLRLGIGPCPADLPPREFVLQEFTEPELSVVTRLVQHAGEAALCWARDGIEIAMSRFNCQIDCQEQD